MFSSDLKRNTAGLIRRILPPVMIIQNFSIKYFQNARTPMCGLVRILFDIVY